jgi:hypothetical protein
MFDAQLGSFIWTVRWMFVVDGREGRFLLVLTRLRMGGRLNQRRQVLW